MRIDIWTDLVCPWCYVGKRRFEHALAAFAHRDQVEVVHRSFELDPGFPRGKTALQQDVLMSKYGLSAERATAMVLQMERTAATEGLEYHLVGGHMGNTFDAHRLLQLARERGVQDAVVERLYRAHFTEQRSIVDHASLVELVAEAGLDADEARSVLQEGKYADVVRADEREAQELGARGVPFFVIGGRYGVSGAESPEVFAQTLARAWADAHPVTVVSSTNGTGAAVCTDDGCAVPQTHGEKRDPGA